MQEETKWMSVITKLIYDSLCIFYLSIYFFQWMSLYILSCSCLIHSVSYDPISYCNDVGLGNIIYFTQLIWHLSRNCITCQVLVLFFSSQKLYFSECAIVRGYSFYQVEGSTKQSDNWPIAKLSTKTKYLF